MTKDFAYLTPGQIRAARAFLRWNAAELAEKAGLGAATVQRAEASDDTSRMTRANMLAIRRALEAAGILFTPEGGMHGAVGLTPVSPAMVSFLAWCDQQIDVLRDQLAPLESGTMHVGRRAPGGPWEDLTESEIARHRASIAELEQIIATYGAGTPHAGTSD